MRRIHAFCFAVILAAVGSLPATLEAAVQTQTRTTAGTVTPTGGWGSPGNAASINGACALGDGSTSGAIAMTNWGFAIPVGATILGVTVRSVSSFNDASTQDAISLTKAGGAVGTAKILNGPGSPSIPSCGSFVGGASGLTVGGGADLWGTTWTPAEINATGFGVFYDNDFFNTAVDGVEITVTFDDGLGPSVTIDQAAGQLDAATTSPINFTVVFSTAVTDFTTGDVTLGGTAGATTAIVTGSGTTYNVAVSGMTSAGTVVATIGAGVASDGVNPNSASTSTDNTVTFAPIAPSVTIDQAGGQIDPTTTSPINFTVTFSTAVTGFAAGDVSFTGSTAPGTLAAVVTGGPAIYNVAVSGMTGGGTVVASIPAGVATDGINTNTASTSSDNSVLFSLAVPLLPWPVLLALAALLGGAAWWQLRRRAIVAIARR